MSHYMGIDLGGTNIAAGVIDENGCVLSKQCLYTKPERGQAAVISDMAKAAEAAVKAAGIPLTDIPYIGIGIPGTVRSDTREVIFAPNISWRGVQLEKEFRKHLDIPVFAANDADCAALGEAYFGCAAKYNSALLITIGTGIGGGFIINKSIFFGCTGCGTEPGHMTVDYGGEQCACGKRGCFETVASATALKRETRRAMEKSRSSLMWEVCGGNLKNISGRTAFDAARRGDPLALVIINAYTDHLAAGVASIVNIFWPEIVIIGGGISAEGDFLLDPLREKMKKFSYAGDILPMPKIMPASLGNDAGIIGAALLGNN
ncbi:MAG: ROK family protein [Oscillospiraceae bacterium]